MIVDRLTRAHLKSAPAPNAAAGSYYILERGGTGAVTGFGVRVYATKKIYVVRWKGKPYEIGRADVIPLEEARELARKRLLELMSGGTHEGHHRSMAQLWAHWWEHNGRDKSDKTGREYRRIWEQQLEPRFGRLKIAHVKTEPHLFDMRRELAATPYLFNRTIGLLNTLFRYAERPLRWIPSNTNPATPEDIKRFEEHPATDSFSPEQYQAIGEVLRSVEYTREYGTGTLAAIWIWLYTGARPGEIVTAERPWLDVGRACLNLPRAKGDRPGKRRGRTIWLPEQAMEWCRRLDEEYGEHRRWLIPGRRIPGRPLGGHLKNYNKPWRSILKRAGVPYLPPKALRHSWRSGAPEAGVAKEHAQGQLGHARGSRVTDEVYLHHEHAAQMAAAQRVADLLARRMESADGEPETVQ